MNLAQRLIIINIHLWAIFIAGYPQAEAAPKFSYWLCRRGTEVRTLRVRHKDSVCSTLYAKEGRDEKVAESKEPELCLSILNKIKSNLQSADWKCKDISNSQITDFSH